MAQLLVRGEGCCVVLGDEAAKVEDDADVGDREGAARVLLDAYDGQTPGLRQAPDNLEALGERT